jgi:DNA-binding NtrC family response regulator
MELDKFPKRPVLIVDDEPDILQVFNTVLHSDGINNTILCQNSRDVISILKEQEIEVILLDLMMPNISGEELLSMVVHSHPEIPVIMITGVYEVDTAVKCIKGGAFDYLLKPIEHNRLIINIRKAIVLRELELENAMLTHHFLAEELEKPGAFAKILTQNNKMRSIFKYCEAIAAGQHPVLITGETGVGKELIAKALHELSGRQGEFIAVNVAGLDDSVFSDTLFGHTKGAFTGAEQIRQGLIEKTNNGTLLLDEIGDLTECSQVKLLRLLEEREYFPIGSDFAKQTDVRILVTTHKDLESLKDSGRFRGDLFYRLRNHHLHLPPLRERKKDIPLLLDHFIDEATKEFGKKKPLYQEELVTLLQNYHFPGNLRELKTMVLDAVSTSKGRMLCASAFKTLKSADIYVKKNKKQTVLNGNVSWAAQLETLPKLKEAANTLIEEAMSRANNNQQLAALLLGITPQALSRRLKRRER